MRQKITLSIEKELLKKAKLMAAKKETSVAKLLTEQLAKMVSEDEQYDSAKKRAVAILKKNSTWEVTSSPNEKNSMTEDRIFGIPVSLSMVKFCS